MDCFNNKYQTSFKMVQQIHWTWMTFTRSLVQLLENVTVFLEKSLCLKLVFVLWMRAFNMADFKMTDRAFCKMTECIVKMNDLVTTLNLASFQHLGFHVVFNNTLSWGTCPSPPHCLVAISTLFRNNLRFSTQRSVIFKGQVMSSYVISHTKLVIWHVSSLWCYWDGANLGTHIEV